MDSHSLIAVSVILPIINTVMSGPVIKAGWVYYPKAFVITKMGNTVQTAGINPFFMYKPLTQPLDSIPKKQNTETRRVFYPRSNEDCTWFSRQRMEQCLVRDLIPNKITGKCEKINSQGDCNAGERSVLDMSGKCLTTKCARNEDGLKCYGGTLPFKGKCYHLDMEIGCNIVTQEFDPYPKTHKYRLLADFFGEGVTCGCNHEYGFILHNGECHSDGSSAACENENQQLVWNRQTGSASCKDNICPPGQMMWRKKACFQNDDKDCFDCKPFHEKVKTCSRGLLLRNDTIYCDNGFGLNSVLGTECSQDSEGRCLDVARPPTPIPRSPLENLCRKYPQKNICQ